MSVKLTNLRQDTKFRKYVGLGSPESSCSGQRSTDRGLVYTAFILSNVFTLDKVSRLRRNFFLYFLTPSSFHRESASVRGATVESVVIGSESARSATKRFSY